MVLFIEDDIVVLLAEGRYSASMPLAEEHKHVGKYISLMPFCQQQVSALTPFCQQYDEISVSFSSQYDFLLEYCKKWAKKAKHILY